MSDKAVIYIGVNEYQGIVDDPEILYTEAEAEAWLLEMQLEHLRADEFDEEEWEAYIENGEGSAQVFVLEIDPSRLQPSQGE